MIKTNISPYAYKLLQTKEMIDAIQPEFDALKEELQTIQKNLFVKSSDDIGLTSYLLDYSIPINNTMSTDQKRGQVLSKKAQHRTATLNMLEQMIMSVVSATKVTVSEENNRTFLVSIDSDYLISNLDIAKESFRKLRPAHFGYTFENKLKRHSSCNIYTAGVCCIKKQIRTEVKE